MARRDGPPSAGGVPLRRRRLHRRRRRRLPGLLRLGGDGVRGAGPPRPSAAPRGRAVATLPSADRRPGRPADPGLHGPLPRSGPVGRRCPWRAARRRGLPRLLVGGTPPVRVLRAERAHPPLSAEVGRPHPLRTAGAGPALAALAHRPGRQRRAARVPSRGAAPARRVAAHGAPVLRGAPRVDARPAAPGRARRGAPAAWHRESQPARARSCRQGDGRGRQPAAAGVVPRRGRARDLEPAARRPWGDGTGLPRDSASCSRSSGGCPRRGAGARSRCSASAATSHGRRASASSTSGRPRPTVTSTPSQPAVLHDIAYLFDADTAPSVCADPGLEQERAAFLRELDEWLAVRPGAPGQAKREVA